MESVLTGFTGRVHLHARRLLTNLRRWFHFRTITYRVSDQSRYWSSPLYVV